MKQSPYVAWAKQHHAVTYNLASSGIAAPPLDDIEFGPEDLDLAGEHEDGWPPLLERLATRYGVHSSQVVLAPGASMANHLVCALLLEPGNTVLVEHPVYEPLHALPRYFHADVKFFERSATNGYPLIAATIEPLLDAGTRLLICSNLHNPSGKWVRTSELDDLAHLAESRGFYILVDEVYLEWLYSEGERTATLLGPRMITTRSLTKAFGLDALRAGWILSSEEIADRLRRLNDLFSITTPFPTERMAARALDHADGILVTLKARLAENRLLVEDFLSHHPELSWIAPDAGPVGFVHLKDGSVDELVTRLLEKDAAVAPGRFFGVVDHFRLGFGMKREILIEGLRRLGEVLQQR
jgi:aspartate/methionine/tyrosine aminotransferase